jgi:hypothetical protein
MGQGGNYDTTYIKNYFANRGFPLTNYKFVSNGLEDAF